ncbi:hypothetical protein KSB_82890 [Ktedonobacter robiniae]|uniref:Uncharacterized protein n=1 Tax=Ktedonobacter robiniae TaxID=2778365 RepID=A0ABQ3V4K3_9CHLR|nr:hypothetical protein KSB_82890 [Ktedonobacter robiniae]
MICKDHSRKVRETQFLTFCLASGNIPDLIQMDMSYVAQYVLAIGIDCAGPAPAGLQNIRHSLKR